MDLFDDFQTEYEKKNNDLVDNNLKSHNWKTINFKDLKIGDKIIINFYPYSQINLFSKYGKIIEIKNEKADKTIFNDELTIENIYLENELSNNFCAAHDWISYYGNNRGYDYEILIIDK